MPNEIAELVSHAEAEPLVPGPPAEATLRLDAGLAELLTARNGLFAFDRALHVFPSSQVDLPVMTLERWNAPSLWTGAYGGVALSAVFFAEDVFGTQFCLRDGQVWSFDPETGEVVQVAPTVASWAALVLGDPDVQVGRGLAVQWRQAHGLLAEGERLAPGKPFVLGGDFTIQNLRAMDAVESMLFRADLAGQLREIPDGTEVELRIK